MRFHVIALWTTAFGFFWEHNNYFGWHLFPRIDAELIADGITALLFAIAWWASGQKS